MISEQLVVGNHRHLLVSFREDKASFITECLIRHSCKYSSFGRIQSHKRAIRCKLIIYTLIINYYIIKHSLRPILICLSPKHSPFYTCTATVRVVIKIMHQILDSYFRNTFNISWNLQMELVSSFFGWWT